MGKILGTLGIFAFGLWVTYIGVMVRLGKLRHLFLGGGFPVLAPLGAFLIAIPLGLGFITIGVIIVFPEWKDPLTIPLILFIISFIILGFWMPGWIQPVWLRWLNDNYGHVLSEMFEEVRQMGIKQWEKETRTQAELEAWADEVARRNGWQRLA